MLVVKVKCCGLRRCRMTVDCRRGEMRACDHVLVIGSVYKADCRLHCETRDACAEYYEVQSELAALFCCTGASHKFELLYEYKLKCIDAFLYRTDPQPSRRRKIMLIMKVAWRRLLRIRTRAWPWVRQIPISRVFTAGRCPSESSMNVWRTATCARMIYQQNGKRHLTECPSHTMAAEVLMATTIIAHKEKAFRGMNIMTEVILTGRPRQNDVPLGKANDVQMTYRKSALVTSMRIVPDILIKHHAPFLNTLRLCHTTTQGENEPTNIRTSIHPTDKSMNLPVSIQDTRHTYRALPNPPLLHRPRFGSLLRRRLHLRQVCS